MNIKDDKGFTGVDITVAIIIVVIFVGIIATLFFNYSITSQEIERQGKASEYSISIIEKIKNDNFEKYKKGENLDYNLYENESITSDSFKDIISSPESGYYVTVNVKDYKKDRPEATIINIIKKITVTVSYKVANQDKDVTISTIISTEGS